MPLCILTLTAYLQRHKENTQRSSPRQQHRQRRQLARVAVTVVSSSLENLETTNTQNAFTLLRDLQCARSLHSSQVLVIVGQLQKCTDHVSHSVATLLVIKAAKLEACITETTAAAA